MTKVWDLRASMTQLLNDSSDRDDAYLSASVAARKTEEYYDNNYSFNLF